MEFGVDLGQTAVDLCKGMTWNNISMRIHVTFFRGDAYIVVFQHSMTGETEGNGKRKGERKW